jgi:hypothetical protein
MTLPEFVAWLRSAINAFEKKWIASQVLHGEQRWPESLSIADWIEQFVMWVGEWNVPINEPSDSSPPDPHRDCCVHDPSCAYWETHDRVTVVEAKRAPGSPCPFNLHTESCRCTRDPNAMPPTT